jgi:hypothetical protein
MTNDSASVIFGSIAFSPLLIGFFSAPAGAMAIESRWNAKEARLTPRREIQSKLFWHLKFLMKEPQRI